MRVKRISLSKAKNDWLKFEKEDTEVTPYQYFNLAQIVFKHYLFFEIREKEFPKLYGIYDDKNRLIMIVPLCNKYKAGKKYYTSFGAAATLAFQNVIFGNDMTEKLMIECLISLKCELGKIVFYNVAEDTMLFHCLMRIEAQQVKNRINVNIPIRGTYDEYFAGLSKSTRQNIRTAYNRMEKDGLSYKFEIFCGRDISNADEKKLMDLYISRRMERYGMSSKIHEFYLRYYHYNTLGFKRVPEGLYALLKINDEIAAFWGGYLYRNEKSIIVPRLAINDKFGRYSPGMILVNETMKIINSKYNVCNLDLSKGDEKYKYSMGGEEYLTYVLSIERGV